MTVATRLRRAATSGIATMLTALGTSTVANACPVCFAADERARMSFLGTAVLLSALPFVLFAGLAFWFWRELDRARGSAQPQRPGTTGIESR